MKHLLFVAMLTALLGAESVAVWLGGFNPREWLDVIALVFADCCLSALMWQVATDIEKRWGLS